MSMDANTVITRVTVEDVKRVLEIGRILRSVLTDEELMELENSMSPFLEEVQSVAD